MESVNIILKHPKALQLLIDLEAIGLINIDKSSKKIDKHVIEMETKLMKRLKNVRQGNGIEVDIDAHLK